MTLKEALYQEIQDKEQVRIDSLYSIAEEMGHKHETASRELRELAAANLITPSKTDKGAINGYYLINSHSK